LFSLFPATREFLAATCELVLPVIFYPRQLLKLLILLTGIGALTTGAVLRTVGWKLEGEKKSKNFVQNL
jgi:hypothetical protein